MGKTLFVSAGLMIIALLLIREITLLPDGALHVHILDVGQGDAILLVTPSGKQVLIDGGPNLAALSHLDRLMPFFDRTIELLVITHPDADHITALPEVLRRYDIDRVLMTGAGHTSGRYDALRSVIESRSIPVVYPDPSVDISMEDGVVLDIIWPTTAYTGASNDQSIVIRVLYKDHAILLTGDIEHDAERAILATGADIRSDILKVAHHGSRTSSSTGFLLAVDPKVGIVSVGKDNRFGHPHTEVLDRYKRLGIPTKTTANAGVISLVFK
jgi:competence protein ComEC